MIKFTSTNIKLILTDDITNNVITVNPKQIEELRDLCNDILQLQKENKLYGKN